MCTVVTRWQRDEPVRLLGIRDELATRAFDDPGEWWPEHPGVIGGRDRQAGGTWCASRIGDGRTAVVLNRPEPRHGTPSRGLLPLAALAHGPDWPQRVDHRAMAGFTLLLAGPDGVRSWEWDGQTLRVHDNLAGTHFVTSHGVDAGDEKSGRYAAQFAAGSTDSWLATMAAQQPIDDLSALIVRHPLVDGDNAGEVYATVFGQLIDARPGRLAISWSHTPWERGDWTERTWEA